MTDPEIDDYVKNVKKLKGPTFGGIRSIASKYFTSLPKKVQDRLFEELDKGTACLTTHGQLCCYLHSYGQMHEAKMRKAFNKLPRRAFVGEYSIVDWGCGQGLASICFLDKVKHKSAPNKITLIDISGPALDRAKIHIEAYGREIQVKPIEKAINEVTPEDIRPANNETVFHLFSNILDVKGVDLPTVSSVMTKTLKGNAYVMAVSPLNDGANAIDKFYKRCKPYVYQSHIKTESLIQGGRGKTWTCKMRVFRVFTPEAYRKFSRGRKLTMFVMCAAGVVLFLMGFCFWRH